MYGKEITTIAELNKWYENPFPYHDMDKSPVLMITVHNSSIVIFICYFMDDDIMDYTILWETGIAENGHALRYSTMNYVHSIIHTILTIRGQKGVKNV